MAYMCDPYVRQSSAWTKFTCIW